MAPQSPRIGVILMNTGTPESPEPEDIRPYLAEFLSDRRLIKVPRPIWLPILHGIILQRRPERSAVKYRQIWTPEGSPFMINSRAQGEMLQQRYTDKGSDVLVEIGERYGYPSITHAYEKLAKAGCTHIIGLPLYPQTAYTQAYTCADEIERINRGIRPDTTSETVLTGYGDQELYIQAVAKSIRDNWTYKPGSKLLFAFHSIPTKDVQQGDTYPTQVEHSIARIADELGLEDGDWALAYQSRFEDSRKWLTPNPRLFLTQWVMESEATDVAVVTPGFAADCLESLYDCDIEQRAFYERLCAEKSIEGSFTYIPALNAMPEHIDLLEHLIDERIAAFEG